MKKLIAFALTFVMVLGTLTACGGSADNGGSKATTVKVIDIELTQEQYAFGVDKNQPELLTQVNDFIKKIKADGTFDEICNKYFGDGTPTGIKSAKLDETKDQLVVATNAEFAPFEYMEGDTFYGIDLEIAALLAEELDKELVISHMDFDAVCLAVGQQKCDIAMAGLTIAEDRKEHVNFSDPYYNASQKLIVMSDCTEFDACSDAAAIEAILNAKDKASCTIGVQTGTTGQLYCEGDEDWGFAGLPVTTKGFKSGTLAVQALLNGNLNYVIIDAAPAARIVESINALQ